MALMSFRSQVQYLRRHPGFSHAPVLSLSRLAAWRIQCALRRGAIVDLSDYGIRLWLPPGWRGTAKLLYAFRDHADEDLRMLLSHVQLGMVVVDIGAHLGLHACAFGHAVGKDGRVLAIEAGQRIFDVLQRNVTLNNLTNVEIRRVAVSDRAGEVKLYPHADPSRATLGGDDEWGDAESVPALTLDALLEDAGIERVDVIKMDIEGAEALALRGATTALAHRPIVAFEVQPRAEARLGVEGEAWRLLTELGYRFRTLDDGQEIHQPPQHTCNVLALPG